MKTETNYRTSIERRNFFQSLLPIFEKLGSYPRLMIEVFLRKNFGPRYYSLSSALTLAFLLICYPLISMFIKISFPTLFNSSGLDYPTAYNYPLPNQVDYFAGYEGWFLFILLFVGFAIARRIEIVKKGSSINFTKHSQYMGDFHPLFWKIKLFGKPVSARLIETFFEPLIFLILGYILNKFDQKLGWVLMVSAVWYSLSYISAYANGTRLIQDSIDNMIVNESLASTFNDEVNPTKSVQEFSQDKPQKEFLRRGNIEARPTQNPEDDENITLAI